MYSINREVMVRKEREGKGIIFVFHKWNRYYLTHIPSMNLNILAVIEH